MWLLPLTLMTVGAKFLSFLGDFCCFCLFLEIFAVFVNFFKGFTLPKMPIILSIFASSSTQLLGVL